VPVASAAIPQRAELLLAQNGHTFSLRMPKTSDGDGRSGARPQILVADDDKAIRTLIGTILTKSGFAVEAVGDGEQAIKALAAKNFDAVVLDLMMPKVDGFEVIDHIARTDPERVKRCVIVLSALADRDLNKLDGRRVYRVIRKPFDLNELVSAVTQCVDGVAATQTSARKRGASTAF